MGNKLYVGNLPYSFRDDDLQQAFAAHGTVTSAKVMMERDTGRSKGFGFVEMGSDAEAQTAISAMNGQQYGGRGLVVNEARPMEPRPPRSGGGGFGGGGGGGGGEGSCSLPSRRLWLSLCLCLFIYVPRFPFACLQPVLPSNLLKHLRAGDASPCCQLLVAVDVCVCARYAPLLLTTIWRGGTCTLGSVRQGTVNRSHCTMPSQLSRKCS